MASLIQSKYNNVSSANSISLTLDSVPQQGNLLVAEYINSGSGALTVPPPVGWTQAISFTDSRTMQVFYKIAGANESVSLTINVTSSESIMTLGVHEYTGSWGLSPGAILYDTGGISSGSTDVSSLFFGPKSGPPADRSLAHATLFVRSGVTEEGNTWTEGFTKNASINASGSGFAFVSSAHRSSTLVTTYETTETWTGLRQALGTLVVFKEVETALTISPVQSGANRSSGPTITVTLSSPPNVGNYLIASFTGGSSSSPPTVVPDGYVMAGQNTTTRYLGVFYRKVLPEDDREALRTVTFGYGASTTGIALVAMEVTGLKDSDIFESSTVTPYSSVQGSTINFLPTPTPANIPTFAVAVVAVRSPLSGFAFSNEWSNGFTRENWTFDTGTNRSGLAVAWKSQATTDEFITSESWNQDRNYVGIAVVFRGDESAIPSSPPSAKVEHSVAGGMTSTSAVVRAKMDRSSNDIKLRVATSPVALSTGTYTEFGPVSVNLGGAFYARITATGLSPFTRYYYGIVGDGVLDEQKIGQFVTTPVPGAATSFSFAHYSCSDTDSNHIGHDHLWQHNPAFLVQHGDFHYHDYGGSDVNRRLEYYDRQLLQPNPERMYRNVGLYQTWDDHDFIGSNSRGRLSDGTYYSGNSSARQAWRIFFPHGPLHQNDPELYLGGGDIGEVAQWGRLRLIKSDLRSERMEGTDNEVMGASQKQWWKDQVLAAKNTGQIVCWVCSMPWIASSNSDTWAGNPTERQELIDYAFSIGMQNSIFVVSGDMHAIALNTGGHVYGGWPVFHAAAMDRSPGNKGGPYTHPPYADEDVRGQWGKVQINDTGGSTIAVDFIGMVNSDPLASHTATVTLAVPAGVAPTEPIVISANAAPWSAQWTPAAPGTYTVRARANLQGGGAINVPPITITVT
jgi:hypothetical protein